MLDIDNLCPSCMTDKGNTGICPHCGFDSDTYKSPSHHLQPGSILNGKYAIGKALGEGGFGITYIGINLNNNSKVAIKEYYPSVCVTRDTTVSDIVSIIGDNNSELFNDGKDKIINEAQTIARFNGIPSIVSVEELFLENGTAYIVMEYIDGCSLMDFLSEHNNKLTVKETLDLVEPIINSLSILHNNGIIHRDISPDNIMIDKQGNIKLIDFGSAKNITVLSSKSNSIQLKHGYAPPEQYTYDGMQGPWTDMYALSATIYRMITGKVPEKATDRMIDDKLVFPSELGIDILPYQEQAIMRGLHLDYRMRTQNMVMFHQELFPGYSTWHSTDKYIKKWSELKNDYKLLIIILAVILFMIIISVAASVINHIISDIYDYNYLYSSNVSESIQITPENDISE